MAWRFELAADIGGRAEQQDRVDVLAAPGLRDNYLVVLADGMGGQRHGADAAQAVVDTARRAFAGLSIANPELFLGDLCRKAHAAIAEIGRQRQSNPASTCAVLYVRGEEAYWAHVGDSRLYHFDGGRLLSRTRDHTVTELLKGGSAPGPAGLGADPADNRVYMCLGGKNQMEPEFGATAVGENDWFILCSDGFWSQVGATEVAQALLAPAADRSSAADLTALATQRGGSRGDNVSLALAIHEHPRLKSVWRRFLPSMLRFGK